MLNRDRNGDGYGFKQFKLDIEFMEITYIVKPAVEYCCNESNC